MAGGGLTVPPSSCPRPLSHPRELGHSSLPASCLWKPAPAPLTSCSRWIPGAKQDPGRAEAPSGICQKHCSQPDPAVSLGHGHHGLGWDQECCWIQPLIHGTVQSQPAPDTGTSLTLDKPWRMLSHPALRFLARGQALCRQGSHSSAQLCSAGNNSWIPKPLDQPEHWHTSG